MQFHYYGQLCENSPLVALSAIPRKRPFSLHFSSRLDLFLIWMPQSFGLWIFNAHVADSVASSSSLTVFCTTQWGLREKRTSWTISQRSCEHRTQAPCQDSTAGFWLSDKNCVRDCATLSSYLLSLVFTLSRPLLAPDKYCKHLCISVP